MREVRSCIGLSCMLVDPEKNITAAFDLCRDLVRGNDRVLLIGIDGVSYEALRSYESLLGGIEFEKITCDAPSTSSTSWTSILTGRRSIEHGIHGVVYYSEIIDETIHLLRNQYFSVSEGIVEGIFGDAVTLPAQTIFENVKESGDKVTLSISRLGFEDNAPLSRALNKGADIQNYCEEYEKLLLSPDKLVTKQLELLEKETSCLDKYFAFCHLNFDTYIHYHGDRTAKVKEGMRVLSNFIDRKRRDESRIVIVSDHGMTSHNRYREKPFMFKKEILEASYAFPGGAGRLHYYYPLLGQEDRMRSILAAEVRDSGRILSRSEYVEEYLQCSIETIENVGAIGDLVAVPVSDSFRTVMQDAGFEHGGFTKVEMLAGISVI